MKKTRFMEWAVAAAAIAWLPVFPAWADGGYFSRRSVAVSADQRAIIIKNGDEVSMTFSTGYSGEGEDFGWIIPMPVVPAIEDVREAGKYGERAFRDLDLLSAPLFSTGSRGGCFPSGTEVLTADGLRAIETVEPGTKVQACNLATGEWLIATVLQRQSFPYVGDMVTIHLGAVAIRATGNHPFFVTRGGGLADRPLPQDVPAGEQGMTNRGRWVEARDLRSGDVLMAKAGGGLAITGLSSRQEAAEVYCLEVERFHNCAMTRAGILAHNSGKQESKSGMSLEGGGPVRVYGTISMEHYEASVLGAADSSMLMNWLDRNGYQVNPAAGAVLDYYIAQRWAFVAVKLNPSQKRHYQNEFLPPLTIGYRHNRLVFPLRISSVSTSSTARITLYFLAESTVSSVNVPTVDFPFEASPPTPVDPESYIESRIRSTLNPQGRTVVLLYGQEIRYESSVDQLARTSFPGGRRKYLTRLEARMSPAALVDLTFRLDSLPREFSVRIWTR